MGLATSIAACSPIEQQPSSADPDAPVAAFYGDSYTYGMGASDPSKRWSTIICEQRGWAEFNASVNGLGFVNNRLNDVPGEIIDENPDLLLITMGLNDNFSGATPSEIERQIIEDLERFDAELPDTRIIVVEPFWYSDDRPESVEFIIEWVKDAAESIEADHIEGASHWIEGHPEWMAPDGLHPNDDGYAEIAERMDSELDRLGL